MPTDLTDHTLSSTPNVADAEAGVVPSHVLVNLLEDTNKAKAQLKKAAEELEQKNKELQMALRAAEEATKTKAAAAAKAAAVVEQKKGKEIRTIIQSIPAALLVVNPDSTIRTANPAAIEMLGFMQVELLGKPVEKLFAAAAAAAATAADSPTEHIFTEVGLAELMKKGKIKGKEANMITKSSQSIPVSISGAVLKDESKTTTGIVIIAQDLRKLRQLEADRTAALKESKYALEAEVADATQELQQINKNLEVKVAERTDELQRKLLELERFNKVTMGREMRILQLKEELAKYKGGSSQSESETSVHSVASEKKESLEPADASKKTGTAESSDTSGEAETAESSGAPDDGETEERD
jgi:PAS domain S-box-containing protein